MMKKILSLALVLMFVLSLSYAQISLMDSSKGEIKVARARPESQEVGVSVPVDLKPVTDPKPLSLQTNADFTLSLKSGLNFISFPLDFGLAQASDVCNLDPAILSVGTYRNAKVEASNYIEYNCSNGQGMNFDINLTQGYVINASSATQISLNGEEVESAVLNMSDGTYFISFPSNEKMDADELLSSVKFVYTELYYYENVNGQLVKRTYPSDFTTLEPGRAYFLTVNGARKLYYPTTSLWRYIYEVVLDKISSIEAQLSSIVADITNINQEITYINQNITNLSQNVTNLNQSVTYLNHSVTNINQNITQLNQTVTNIDQDITILNQNITQLNQTVTEINQNVTVLSQNITELNQTVYYINQTYVTELNQTINQTIIQVLNDSYYNITQIDAITNQTYNMIMQVNDTLYHNITEIWDYIHANESAWLKDEATTYYYSGGGGGSAGYSYETIQGWINKSVEPVQEQIDDLNRRVDALQPANVQDLENETQYLKERIKELELENENLRNNLTYLEQRINTIENNIGIRRTPLTGLTIGNFSRLRLPKIKLPRLNLSKISIPKFNISLPKSNQITGFLTYEVSYEEQARENPCGFLGYKCWTLPDLRNLYK